MKLRPLTVSMAVLALLTLFAKSRIDSPKNAPNKDSAVVSGERRTPVDFCRDPGNTFLTLPEWYLVYSPREYAHFIDGHSPSQFPYWRHLGQFWQGYHAVYQAANDERPFNFEYHLMIWVIGTSTTFEYGLKSTYETVVGRAAEATVGSDQTAEERLAIDVAHQYEKSLDAEPWYNFDFVAPLKRLWQDTAWWGDHPLRKWERRYFLTSEYLAKATYAWGLKQSTENSFGVESSVTVVVLNRTPSVPMAAIKILETFTDGAVLAQLPRYQSFTPVAATLAKVGVDFLEIAGNAGPILVTAIVPESYQPIGIETLFEQPITTQPTFKRIAFVVKVRELNETLRHMENPQLRLEHIYDY